MRGRLESLSRRLWYERERPNPILSPLARLYGAMTASRGQRPARRPPVPVIVVGNLTAGGSGKTPVVEALACHFEAGNRRVAIVSRGYGGEEPSCPLRVDADMPARVAGDEARMLARSIEGPVWVCRDRGAALEAAVAAGADIVLADDGLQNAGLARSFELCVVDGRRGFGNGALLPAGPLRQTVDRLGTVDAVLVKQPVLAELPFAEFETFELRAGGIRPLAVDSTRARPVRLESGASIDAVAGIADPSAFFDDLRRHGFDVREHPLADHARIDPAWLRRLQGPVVLTAKDAARIDDPPREDLFVAAVEAVLPATLIATIEAHVREFSA